MWTLFKSVMMFFKKGKILLFGLIILIFSSSLVFTSLNGVSSNLQESYNVLSQNGNLNDFVINEKYTLGIVEYSYTLDTTKNTATIEPTIDSTTKKIVWTDSYLNFYNQYKSDKSYEKYLVRYVYNYSGTVSQPTITDEMATFEIEKLKSELLPIVTSFVENSLLNELNKLPISYRSYKAIDINNNQQNVFYKVVESLPDYSINKLVIYDGNNLTPEQNLDNIINNFHKDTNKYSRMLLELLSKATWSDTDTLKKINDTIKFFNDRPNENPYEYKKKVGYSSPLYLHQVIGYNGTIFGTEKQEGFIHQIIDKKSFSNKGFKIDFNVSFINYVVGIPVATVPIVASYIDYTAYQAVVTPSYLDTFNKSVFPLSEFNKHLKDSQEEFNTWFGKIDQSYKVPVDNTNYLIIGSGISPDYMYPVVSFDRPVPNYNNEAIVYTNPHGYERISDAFRGNNVESFIVGKFNKNANQEYVLNRINEIAQNLMSWPSGTKAAYLAGDLNNTLTPAALRLQFVPDTLTLTTIISTSLTLVILFLSVIVSIFIIKKFIESNRNNLGILLANGFKKFQIIIPIIVFLAIPILIGTIFGYLLGFALQIPILSLFLNFWTIPMSLAGFSVVSFVVVIIAQLVLFISLGAIFSIYSLRGEVSELMKDDSKYKMSKFAMLSKKPFLKFGVMASFRSAVAFQSLWRLFLLSVMSGLTIVSIVFSLSTNNKFNQAALDTYKSRNYAYSYKLITPTVEAGQYYAVPYQYSGMTLEKGLYFSDNKLEKLPSSSDQLISQNYLSSSYYSTTQSYPNDPSLEELIKKYGNYHLLSATDDNNGQAQDLMYLKNKTENQVIIDHFLGSLGIGANPWQIAIKLMPNNQINYANNSFRNMLNHVLLDSTNKVTLQINNTSKEYTYQEALKLFVKLSSVQSLDNPSKFIDTQENKVYEFDSSKLTKSYSGIANIVLVPEFVEFFLTLFENPDYFQYTYNINFNRISIDHGDRPYSYVDFQFKIKNGKDFKTANQETLIGIDNSSNYVNLTNLNNETINWKLYGSDNSYIPVIANAYAQKKYDLKIGDTFKISSSNRTDRYYNEKANLEIINKNLKIVDILSTYQGSEFFVSQENANKLIGLKIAKDNENNFDYKRSGFNGVFSNSKNLAIITKGISLYSPSGIYPASDLFNPEDANLIGVLNANAPASITSSDSSIKTNLDWAKKITNISAPTNAKNFIEQLSAKYGSSASYYALINLVDKNSTEKIFLSLGSTFNDVQISVIAVIVAISLVIVILISSMIILDSLKLAAYLKCLGLSDFKNAFSFLMIYFPVFLFGLALAVPIVFLLILIYTESIFNSAGILLIVSPTFLNFFVPMVCVLMVFFISFVIAWLKIKNTKLPQILK